MQRKSLDCSNNTNKLSPQERGRWTVCVGCVQIIQINLVLKNHLEFLHSTIPVQIIQINLVLKNAQLAALEAPMFK